MTLSSNVTNSASALKSLADFRGHFLVERLIDRREDAAIHQLLDHVLRFDIELLGKIPNRQSFGQRDLAEFARRFDFRLRPHEGRVELPFGLAFIALAAIHPGVAAGCAAGVAVTECGRTPGRCPAGEPGTWQCPRFGKSGRPRVLAAVRLALADAGPLDDLRAVAEAGLAAAILLPQPFLDDLLHRLPFFVRRFHLGRRRRFAFRWRSHNRTDVRFGFDELNAARRRSLDRR